MEFSYPLGHQSWWGDPESKGNRNKPEIGVGTSFMESINKLLISSDGSGTHVLFESHKCLHSPSKLSNKVSFCILRNSMENQEW